jgi:hypothetical protein
MAGMGFLLKLEEEQKRDSDLSGRAETLMKIENCRISAGIQTKT